METRKHKLLPTGDPTGVALGLNTPVDTAAIKIRYPLVSSCLRITACGILLHAEIFSYLRSINMAKSIFRPTREADAEAPPAAAAVLAGDRRSRTCIILPKRSSASYTGADVVTFDPRPTSHGLR